MSEGIELHQVAEEDREEIAELIYLSLNTVSVANWTQIAPSS